MALRTIVLYATNQGTATARPATMWFEEDEAWALDPALYPNTGKLALAEFLLPAVADVTRERVDVTVNPGAGTYAAAVVSTLALEARQTEMRAVLARLQQEASWTQELDARLTPISRRAWRDYIAALEAVPADPLWATNPEAIALPAAPAIATLSRDLGLRLERGFGLNQIDNARGLMGVAGWAHSGAGTVHANTVLQTSTAVETVFQLNQVGASVNGKVDYSQALVQRLNRDGTVSGRALACRPGDWVEWSFSYDTLGGPQADAFLIWYAEDGSGFTVSSFVPLGVSGAIQTADLICIHDATQPAGYAAGNADTWRRITILAKCPVGYTFATGAIRRYGSAQAVSLVRWYKPMLCPAWEGGIDGSDFTGDSGRIVGRDMIQRGAISDFWQMDANGPFANATQQLGTVVDLGQFLRGDIYHVALSLGARTQASATPSFKLQAQYNNSGTWVDLWTLPASGLTSTYQVYHFGQILTGGFTNVKVRAQLVGGGTATTAQVALNVTLTAQKVTV